MIPLSNLPRKTKKVIKSLLIKDLIGNGLNHKDANLVMKNIYNVEVAKGKQMSTVSAYKGMFIMQWQHPLFIRDLLRSKEILGMCFTKKPSKPLFSEGNTIS